MKALILAAGYGTRFAKDLEKTDQHKELRGIPKPLLPIGGSPLISHWMQIIKECPSLTEIYLVANKSNKDKFYEWAKDFPQVKIVVEKSTCNEERTGAVGCIDLAINHFDIKDNLIVIGGDTLFYKDFSLKQMIERFETTPSISQGGALVTCCRCGDHETSKFGILEVDQDGCVTRFLEKPSPDVTESRLSCPCFYMFSSHTLHFFKTFLEETKQSPLSKRDAPGNFIKYISSKAPVYTYRVSGRFDVGNLESYIQYDQNYL